MKKIHQPAGARKGFTLIELLVAIGLFSVVVSISAGGLVQAFRTQRQAAALISANSNVSLALEQIAREIRTGYDFCKTVNCPNQNQLFFKNAKKQSVAYCLIGGSIQRAVGAVTCSGDTFRKITADNVEVKDLRFRVLWQYPPGGAPGDNFQPRIIISVGVTSKEASLKDHAVYIQTTVSPRLPLDDGSS